MTKTDSEGFIKKLPTIMEKHQVELVQVKPDDYAQQTKKLIDFIVGEKKLDCIYISFNKPYKNLLETMKENEIDTEKIYFIDLISVSTGMETKETKNSVFIDEPTNLTKLGIAVGEALKKHDAEKTIVVLDSLSAMIIHNKEASVSYIHVFATKLRGKEVPGIILSEAGDDNEIIQKITSVVDESITVGG